MPLKNEILRICQQCGKEFPAWTTVTKYCSNYCAKKVRRAKAQAKKIEASHAETRRIREQPMEALKARVFLSIAQTSTLLGVSRRTVCRMIQRGDLIAGKAGRRTILRRSDIDRIFEPQSIKQTQT